MSHKLRQRKKKQKEKQPQNAPTAPTNNQKANTKSAFQRLFLYILGAVLLFISRHVSHYLILKRPDLVNRVVPNLLRSAVGFLDERQVLIVGTMSSGTSQVAWELTSKLGLEIGHEVTDALDYHVRDGTSSWFHGIRFFSTENKDTIVHDLCYNFTEKMGFHPRQYHATTCSEKKPWFPLSDCWRKDCIDLLNKEWGCAVVDGCKDTQPFQRTLLQIRDPRSTVESLVAKFCKDENDKTSLHGQMQPDWIKFHSILFQHDFAPYNCIEAASYYVMEYNKNMIQQEKEHIDAMYKVETTPPCNVAMLAGFMNYRSTVYKPNYQKVQRKCTHGAVGTKPMGSSANQINKGRVRLEWSDYQGGKYGSLRDIGDDSLEQDMRAFMESIGYDPDSERPQ